MTEGDNSAGHYRVEVAGPDQIEIVQQLRYRIFAEEPGARLPHTGDGLERDEFDPHCEHLMVRDLASGRIVASTRVLNETSVGRIGRFY